MSVGDADAGADADDDRGSGADARGTAFVFGDDVNTDYITPTEYMSEAPDRIAEHLFEPIDPTFPERFDPGDVIVAGENFGAGSSREQAPAAIRAAGAGAVVAESFARLFYRNAIAIGLPAIACPGVTDAVEDGDTVLVDLDAETVTNERTGADLPCESYPPAVREIFEDGGLLAHYRARRDGADAGGE
ncbi:MAG: 3-isopropylmalate dehydratase [Haloferacaceae archaeon]